MGKKRKQADAGGGAEEHGEPKEHGPDPNFRLVALHPTRSLCAVAVGAHLRVVDYR